MTQYKEFQAKSLDDAIREACDYFGVEREKLEIDIVSDAKTGIFGLVGAKKAAIRARRQGAAVNVLKDEAAEPDAGGPKTARRQAGEEEPKGKPQRSRGARQGSGASAESKRSKEPGEKARRKGTIEAPPVEAPPVEVPLVEVPSVEAPASEVPVAAAPPPRRDAELDDDSDDENDVNGNVLNWPSPQESGRRKGKGRDAKSGSQAREGALEGPRRKQHPEKKRAPAWRDAPAAADADSPGDSFADSGREDLPEFDLSACDPGELKAKVAAVVTRLVRPIVGDVPCEVSIANDRVRARLDCGDASGLLVGREGQTLASVQYLATRILARELGGALRLHVDAGHYREKQDDRLKELAQSLAARVKKTRRSQMTRPLSAYQRRIVHLALEGDPEVSTRSKGEGTQRRVMIFLLGKQEANGRAEGRGSVLPDED